MLLMLEISRLNNDNHRLDSQSKALKPPIVIEQCTRQVRIVIGIIYCLGFSQSTLYLHFATLLHSFVAHSVHMLSQVRDNVCVFRSTAAHPTRDVKENMSSYCRLQSTSRSEHEH
jgi:hypothetical protein